jgi:hypothetical protein
VTDPAKYAIMIRYHVHDRCEISNCGPRIQQVESWHLTMFIKREKTENKRSVWDLAINLRDGVHDSLSIQCKVLVMWRFRERRQTPTCIFSMCTNAQ